MEGDPLDQPRLADELFDRANRARVEAGSAPLQRDARLDAVATAYARELAQRDKLDHTGARGATLADRIRVARITWLEAGENLARNNVGADPVGTAIDGWRASPAHRRHLLNPRFLATGVGVARDPDNGLTYFVQLYLLPP